MTGLPVLDQFMHSEAPIRPETVLALLIDAVRRLLAASEAPRAQCTDELRCCVVVALGTGYHSITINKGSLPLGEIQRQTQPVRAVSAWCVVHGVQCRVRRV